MRNIGLPEGVWDFAERLWQIAIFDDMWPKLVIKKAAQIGMTVIMLCKTLHFLDQRKRSRGMYTLPRQDDLYTFVPARLVPMIKASPYLQARVGTDKDDPQGVRLRRIGSSYLYFSEGSVEPREVPVDILANDEVDRSNQEFLDQYEARLDASPLGYHYRFSTPTISGFGISRLWEQSDRREWFVKCTRCNKEQMLDWEKTLNFDRDGQPFFGCVKCRLPLDPEAIINGQWIPTATSVIHGYHVSHMMLPLSKPAPILYQQSLGMKSKNFANLRLGNTFVPSAGGMPPEIFDVCFEAPYEKAIAPDGKHPYYVGVDQANDIHVLIGKKVGPSLDVVYATVLRYNSDDSWDRLGKLIQRFRPACCIIDALPNRHNVKTLAKELRGRRIYAAFYDTNPQARQTLRPDRNEIGEQVVFIHHTDSFDELRDDISAGKIGLWGRDRRDSPTIVDIVDHCNNIKRDEEERNTKVGLVTIGVWRATGATHWANALNYLHKASQLHGTAKLDARIIGKPEKPKRGGIAR